MVKNFAIVLSQPPQGEFHPGSEVAGKLMFQLSEPKAYRYIKVTVIGEARVFGDKGTTRISRSYINSEFILWSSEQASHGRLESGQYSFPFQVTLPRRLPSSLNRPGVYAIQYYVQGRIVNAGGKFDHTALAGFRVVEVVDTNVPAVQRPIRGLVQKTGGLFTASGVITLTAESPHRGYCIGEAIPLNVTVENGSSKQIEILVELWKIVTTRYHRYGDRNRILSHPRLPVSARRSGIFHFKDRLRVPPTVPTMTSCDIITAKYVLVVTAVIPWATNSKVKIPLTIGNVPPAPRQDASDPPPPPVSSPSTHPPQGSSELTRDPPPSYELACQYY